MPHRARASDVPIAGLGAVPRGEREVRRCRRRGGPWRRPGRAGAGLPLRAAAADDPRAAPQRDDHHVLAHPVAEPGGVRHLPVARRTGRRPARQRHPRLSHAVPLQQLPGDRRPVRRGAHRPRDVHRRLPRRTDRRAPLSDLDRVAARAARPCVVDLRGARARARPFRPAARSQARRGHRPPRLHEGHHRTVQRRRAPAGGASGMDRSLHVRADRGAHARHDRRLPGLCATRARAGGARSTRATRAPRIRRSC